jgi:hypothetical protein
MTIEPDKVVSEEEQGGSADVRILAREHTAAAIKRLKHWLDSDNERVSLAAATALLERGWGKGEGSIEATITRITVIRAPMIAADADTWREQYAPPNIAALPQD